MAEQLRGEGLDVTTDPARARGASERAREHAAVGFLPGRARSGRLERERSHGPARQRRVARTRTRNVDGFFDDLAVGSYVVHRQHGVARFSGTTTRAINGVTRDYLILSSKTVAATGRPSRSTRSRPTPGATGPSLSRMGGAEWQKTRAKARAAAFLVAQELVDLYRLRTVAEGPRLQPRYRLAARDGRALSLHTDGGSGPGDPRREGRHGVAAPDGPLGLCGRRFWQDRGGAARGFQGGAGQHARRRYWCPRPCSPASTSPPSPNASRAFP